MIYNFQYIREYLLKQFFFNLGHLIRMNELPISMISLENTKLSLQGLGLEGKIDTSYSLDIPPYLKTLFPMHGTTQFQNTKDTRLYLPRAANAFLIRWEI